MHDVGAWVRVQGSIPGPAQETCGRPAAGQHVGHIRTARLALWGLPLWALLRTTCAREHVPPRELVELVAAARAEHVAETAGPMAAPYRAPPVPPVPPRPPSSQNSAGCTACPSFMPSPGSKSAVT